MSIFGDVTPEAFELFKAMWTCDGALSPELDLGLIRDSTLNRNDTFIFFEKFSGLAR